MTKVYQDASIEGRVREKAVLKGCIRHKHYLKGKIIIPVSHGNYPGPYTVIPSDEDQIFPTKDFRMSEDFTVTAVPYREELNSAGGLTAIIG